MHVLGDRARRLSRPQSFLVEPFRQPCHTRNREWSSDPVTCFALPHHSAQVSTVRSRRQCRCATGASVRAHSNRTYDSRRRRRTQAGRNRLLSRFNWRVPVAHHPSQDAEDTDRPAATSSQTGQGKAPLRSPTFRGHPALLCSNLDKLRFGMSRLSSGTARQGMAGSLSGGLRELASAGSSEPCPYRRLPHCNEQQGMSGRGTRVDNGRGGIGPFATFAAADALSRRLPGPAHRCRVCLPVRLTRGTSGPPELRRPCRLLLNLRGLGPGGGCSLQQDLPV